LNTEIRHMVSRFRLSSLFCFGVLAVGWHFLRLLNYKNAADGKSGNSKADKYKTIIAALNGCHFSLYSNFKRYFKNNKAAEFHRKAY
ncbi:hypothetical protein CJ307_33190, partial [Klebsiella quasipneumoniae]